MAVPGHGACRRDLRTYAYNGDGLLQTRTGGVGATFLWDPATSPSRELKQGNDNIIYGLGPLYVVKGDTTTLIFARDGSKSVRAEINSSGAVTASFRYRAYGQLAADGHGRRGVVAEVDPHDRALARDQRDGLGQVLDRLGDLDPVQVDRSRDDTRCPARWRCRRIRGCRWRSSF